jgi:hypothetical protein
MDSLVLVDEDGQGLMYEGGVDQVNKDNEVRKMTSED